MADIFNNNTKPEDDQPNGDTVHTANETTSILGSYVGDDKKYKTPEEEKSTGKYSDSGGSRSTPCTCTCPCSAGEQAWGRRKSGW